MIIDVSKWQGKIDWSKVKASHPEIEGVYIKASEGIGYTDPMMTINAVGATKEGFKVGFYHFATLNAADVTNDAQSEAKWFIKSIGSLTRSMPMVLDIEKNVNNLPKDKVLLWVKSFFNELHENAINDVMLYSYTPFLDSNLPANHDLGTYPLWIAAYTPALKLPHGWDKQALWQYSEHGVMDGVSGFVDLNKTP